MKNVGVLTNPGDLAIVEQLFPVSSITSLTVGYGSQTLIVAAGLKLIPGFFYRLTSTATPFTWMEGKCVSYSGTTLILNVDFISGSGTFSNWLIIDSKDSVLLAPTATYSTSSLTQSNVPGLSFNALAAVSYQIILHGLFLSFNSSTKLVLNLAATSPTVMCGLLRGGIAATANSGTSDAPLRAGQTSITALAGSVTPEIYIGVDGFISFAVDTTVSIQIATNFNGQFVALQDKSRLQIKRIS